MDMKLSEAIRNGSKLRAASEHGWVDQDANGNPRTCAIVAATEAAGLLYHDGAYWRAGFCAKVMMRPVIDVRTGEAMLPDSFTIAMPEEWAKITRAMEVPPCPCKVYGVLDQVMEIIWHLHDIHRWSREAVAEWIGTVEKKVEERNALNHKVSEPSEKQNCDAPELAEKR